MNKIINFLDWTENNNFGKFLYIVFFPIVYLLEYICYRYYWFNIIFNELLTKEEVLEFLDQNEFGFGSGKRKIYKKDIIAKDDYLDNLKVEEINLQVKKEYVNSIITMINEYSSSDIEEYINMTTNVKILPESKLKQYEVSLQYYRFHILKTNLFWFLLYIISIIGILAILLSYKLI